MSTQIRYKGEVVTTFEKGTITLHTDGDRLDGDIEVVSEGGGGSGGGSGECTKKHIVEVDALPTTGEDGTTYVVPKFTSIAAQVNGASISDFAEAFEISVSKYYTSQTLPETCDANDVCYVESENEIYYALNENDWYPLGILLLYMGGLSISMKGEITDVDEMAEDGYYAMLTPDFYYYKDGLYRHLLYEGELRFVSNGDGTCFVSKLEAHSEDSINIPTLSPNGDMVTRIGSSAFQDYTSLKNITLPNSVTDIGSDAFSGCIGLSSITLPDSLCGINSYAFYKCSSLKEVVIPDSVSAIDIGAFSECLGLEWVTISAGVVEIASSAFCHCISLRNISIPEGVVTIKEDAFNDCISMQVAVIRKTVKNIGARAFRSCTSLTSIRFEGTKAQWNAISKGEDWNYNVPVTEVICTDGNVAL